MFAKSGILEIASKGNGRLRGLDGTILASSSDPVIPIDIINRFELRAGIALKVELGQPVGNGQSRKKGKNRQNRQSRQPRKNKKEKLSDVAPDARIAKRVINIEGNDPQQYLNSIELRKFENLTTIDPKPRMILEHPGCPPVCRLVDMFCPIGYGQRGMIVSPPKAGKTILLQHIAIAISKNHPDVEVTALLIDERPEEVTDFRRNVPCRVLASSNDHTPDKHCALAMLAIDRAKRHAEAGKDVVILLDSLTRLGRAFNTAPGMSNSGRTLSGGMDSTALAIPKQLFGAARRFEEGGSLTIIATALVDTGSRGDELIFEEFKGTGNMELILDRKIAERRIFPAINLAASGTRKEHLLMGEDELATTTALRRRLFNMHPPQQIEQLLKALERFETNAELVGGPKQGAPVGK